MLFVYYISEVFMKLYKISDIEVLAFLSKEDINDVGAKDEEELKDAVLRIVQSAAGSGLGFYHPAADCEITEEKGYMITLTAKKKKQRKENRKTVLCFDSGDALYTACVFLSDKNITESSLLCEGKGGVKTYYLILEYENTPDTLRLDAVSELCSSVYIDKNAFLYYIYEHSYTLIEKNAVYDIANSKKTW